MLFVSWLICLGAGSVASGYQPKPDANQKAHDKKQTALDRYDKIISITSKRHDVDPALVKAVIAAESSMNPRAVSKKGARGLMQLMPKTAKSMGVTNLAHPRQNIEGGTKYLKYLMDEYDGDIKVALAAYNAGPGTVNRYKGVPPYKATRRYIKKVLAFYYAFKTENDS